MQEPIVVRHFSISMETPDLLMEIQMVLQQWILEPEFDLDLVEPDIIGQAEVLSTGQRNCIRNYTNICRCYRSG